MNPSFQNVSDGAAVKARLAASGGRLAQESGYNRVAGEVLASLASAQLERPTDPAIAGEGRRESGDWMTVGAVALERNARRNIQDEQTVVPAPLSGPCCSIP